MVRVQSAGCTNFRRQVAVLMRGCERLDLRVIARNIYDGAVVKVGCVLAD